MGAELLSRSHFSLLEGASHPSELVQAALEGGLTALGVVDRDCVYGLVQAHKAARDVGLPLVCGSTLTLEHRPPVALLVENHTGWSNLCRLLTSARSAVEKGRASTKLERLLDHSAGLTIVLRYGWTAEWAEPILEAFGDRVEVALTRTLSPTDRQRTRWAHDLSRALNTPLLASNDAVCHHPSRKALADVLTCIRRRTVLSDAAKFLAANGERYVLSDEAFRARFRDVPQAVRRSVEVAERCTFSLDELTYLYPREVVPEGWSPMPWLKHLIEEGLASRYPDGVPAPVRAQIAHECDVIEQLNFPAYFLTVYDIVKFARSQGILCQGRGSAANSSICYALGITAVDPGRASLLFERFISKERGEPPDIDVDFEHERREEVIQYIYGRYGRHRAALVNEVICYRMRSAIRDVGKVFGLSLDQVDRLAKSTDRWSAGMDVKVEELVEEAGLDPNESAVRQTLAMAEELRGFPRHLSIHVGGFTITEGDLIDLVPVEPATMAERTVIQWDKYDIDILRFVKVDVLGLGILTAIRRAFDLILKTWDKSYTLATVPAEDPTVYDMFCKADTVGVFQIESRAQMSMLPRLKPRCFYDLVIEVAIVRPGPIQGGMVHPYLRRRNGEEPISYNHPALRPILERTLGVPLFQEQVMAMAVAVGGFTAGEADELRRAMGAWRKRGTLNVIGKRLVKGMIERGISEEYSLAIFEQIKGFGEYGFPESHAASFALLVYVTGWIKCHYPEAFTAALINSQPMGFYSPRALIADAKRHGVVSLPVCVVNSDYDCTLEPQAGTERAAIRLGFRLIKGFGETDANAITEARAVKPFDSLADLACRTYLDRGKLQMLAESGSLASLGPDRRQAVWELQGLWTELPLFAGVSRKEPAAKLPRETPWEALRADYRSTGLSVDRHPVELLRPSLEKRGLRPLCELVSRPPGQRVQAVGLVSSRQRPGTANGVIFMTLEDETAMTNLVIWPRVWAAHRRLARSASLLGIDGQLQRAGDAVSVLVDRFWPVDADLVVKARNFH